MGRAWLDLDCYIAEMEWASGGLWESGVCDRPPEDGGADGVDDFSMGTVLLVGKLIGHKTLQLGQGLLPVAGGDAEVGLDFVAIETGIGGAWGGAGIGLAADGV